MEIGIRKSFGGLAWWLRWLELRAPNSEGYRPTPRRVTFDVGRSVGLDKCVMTGTHHRSVTQSMALKILCTPPAHLSSFPSPGDH